MSMRYLMALIALVGLGSNGLAIALDGSPSFAQRTLDMSPKITSRLRSAIEMADSHSAPAQTHHAMRGVAGTSIEMFVDHDCADRELSAVVEQGGQILNDRYPGTTHIQLHYGLIAHAAALPCTRQFSMPNFATLRTGRVTSAGDVAMRADELRANLGVDGSGVRIGIISDSLINLQTSVDSGDLPPDIEIINGRDGSGAGSVVDEGRAMAEIIHDLAPGATLLFHTGIPTSLDMIAAIGALTEAGAHIIVDDLGFFGEPFFEDGPVAQAVQGAIDAGVLYVTAVGNDADANYSGMYQEFDPDDDDPQNNLHDFGGGDPTMRLTIPPGSSFQAILQWPNRFDGSANTADYDLMVLDDQGVASACLAVGIAGTCVSSNQQATSPMSPIETIFVQNATARSVVVNLAINRVSGEALPLRMVLSGAFTMNEHNVPSRSAFGHPCVREAMAVGAINANDPGFDTIEPFSSRGPCEIFFTTTTASVQASLAETDGFRTSQVVALTTPEIRNKPDVAAADGTHTSLAFFAPFFGTSAAAPHAAAVAALLMDLGGGPGVVSASRALATMRVAAVDEGALGVDHTYGFGVVDAVLAGEVLQSATNVPPIGTINALADDMMVTAGETVTFQGTCTDAENQTLLTFDWDFGGGADIASSAAQNPSAVFSTPGTFTITMICQDALGAPSLPVTASVIVNPADESDGSEDEGTTAASSGGGGGGGCTLVTGTAHHPLSALGHLGLPMLTLAVLWLWRHSPTWRSFEIR